MTREAALKVAKPILFNTEMTWAIQNRRKTETRRIAKPQPPKDAKGTFERMDNGNFQLKVEPYDTIYDYEIKPKYQVGDILYVRETWQYVDEGIAGDDNAGYVYKASENGKDWETGTENWKWRPAIHMPKEAARIFLQVTSLRAERLQEITITGLQGEGILSAGYVSQYATMTTTAFEDFKGLWNGTIKKADLDKYGYDADPAVFVYGLELLEVE